jgi:hypothetical protein
VQLLRTGFRNRRILRAAANALLVLDQRDRETSFSMLSKRYPGDYLLLDQGVKPLPRL